MINSLAGSIALGFFLVTFRPIAGFSETAPSAGSSGNQERLALLPFETRGFSSEDRTRLQQSFAAGLAESKRYDFIPEEKIKGNLEQAGLTSFDSCNTLPCLAQLGKALNVEKVVHVRAERWDQRFMLHIQLVRSSDAVLLYDERVDYAGDLGSLSTIIAPEQGRKVAAAFLDKKPNWVLIGAVVLVCVGLIFWLFTTLGSVDNSVTQGHGRLGPQQQTNSSA